MQPDPAYTVIMTQTIKASRLTEATGYGPLFIDDNSPQSGCNGPATFARRVKLKEYWAQDIDRSQIVVEFCDGTGVRVFDLNDDVVVHNILPGTDLRS